MTNLADIRSATTYVNAAKSLADLLTRLQSVYREMGEQDWKNFPANDLPTFGGEEPADTSGCWSWDETHLLVGDGGFDTWEIIERDNSKVVYMNAATGSTGTRDEWWYEDENGKLVNAVDLKEVVAVE